MISNMLEVLHAPCLRVYEGSAAPGVQEQTSGLDSEECLRRLRRFENRECAAAEITIPPSRGVLYAMKWWRSR